VGRRSQKRHIVTCNGRVCGYKRQILGLCLGDQHPVKWVVMMPWQAARCDGMGGLNRQHVETHALKNRLELVQRESQPAERMLDRDFPRRGGTDENLVRRRRDSGLDPLIQTGWLPDRPEKNMGIEEKFQRPRPSNTSSISSGNGSSKSTPVVT
jgi:hypothetical protein